MVSVVVVSATAAVVREVLVVPGLDDVVVEPEGSKIHGRGGLGARGHDDDQAEETCQEVSRGPSFRDCWFESHLPCRPAKASL